MEADAASASAGKAVGGVPRSKLAPWCRSSNRPQLQQSPQTRSSAVLQHAVGERPARRTRSLGTIMAGAGKSEGGRHQRQCREPASFERASPGTAGAGGASESARSRVRRCLSAEVVVVACAVAGGGRARTKMERRLKAGRPMLAAPATMIIGHVTREPTRRPPRLIPRRRPGPVVYPPKIFYRRSAVTARPGTTGTSGSRASTRESAATEGRNRRRWSSPAKCLAGKRPGDRGVPVPVR